MRTLVLAAAAIALLTSCADEGDPVPSAADPAQAADVVRRYFDAYNAGDVDGLNATSCSSAQRETATAPDFESILSDVEEPVVERDSARVPVELFIDSDGVASTPSRTQIYLTSEDGHWGVCMFERPTR